MTPAGRKRYLEVLVPHILNQRPHFSAHIFWLNTTVKADIDYIKNVCRLYPDFFSYTEPRVPVDGNNSISHFFKGCVEEDAIYIRFDDDICWLSPSAVREIVNFRLENPEYFLIFGNIVNNSLCNYLHQRIGALDLNVGDESDLAYTCTDAESWGKGVVASRVHDAFLKALELTDERKYSFGRRVLADYERFSINFMAWFGRDFAEFNGEVGSDKLGIPRCQEEPWLTEWAPKVFTRPNCICGEALAAHYAFYPQRDYLESETNILERYKELARRL